ADTGEQDGRVQPGERPTTRGVTLDVAIDAERAVARPGQPVLIGRDPGCHIRLYSPLVSRRHAEVCWTADGWVLRDLGSRNGTWLDGRRIDEVRVGDAVQVRLGSAWPDGPLVRFGAAAAAVRETPAGAPAPA